MKSKTKNKSKQSNDPFCLLPENNQEKSIDLFGSNDKKKKDKHQKLNIYRIFQTKINPNYIKPQRINSAHIQIIDYKKIPHILPNLMRYEYILHDHSNKKFLYIDEQDKFIWDYLDGKHSLCDIAIKFYDKYHTFGYTKIKHFLKKLEKNNFLLEKSIDYLFNFKNPSLITESFNKILNFIKKIAFKKIEVRQIDFIFDKLYKILKFFLNSRWFLGINILIIYLGFLMFIFHISGGQDTFSSIEINKFQVVFVVILSSLLVIFHEFGHAIACKYFNRKVDKAGFMIYFGFPVFYVNTSEIWLENRLARIIVSLGGIFVDAWIGSIFSLFAAITPSLFYKKIFIQISLISYLSIFFNLNPFLEFDGYYVLIDFIGIPRLKQNIIDFFKKPQKIITNLLKLDKLETFYLFFGIFSFIWSIIAILMAFQFWLKIFKNFEYFVWNFYYFWDTIFIILIIFIALAGYLFLKLIKKYKIGDNPRIVTKINDLEQNQFSDTIK